MADETAKSSPPINYAFLNHSTTTVPNKLPPSVDDKPLARQKRRRTSPEDQAILETAYKRDPKPDKTARLELVKHVALGEKEVQIWFQNRRQSSRRKSRPLLPHEVAQYQLSRAGLSGGSPQSSQESNSPEHREEDLGRHSRESTPPGPEDTEQTPQPLSAPCQGVSTSTTASIPDTCSFGPLQSLGCIANRRSAASLVQQNALEQLEQTEEVKVEPDRRIRKTASFVRLSLNAEGKAEVVTKDAASPSPPRPPQTLLLEGPTSMVPTAPAVKQLQRSYSGRSRDSRSWEFWCDKDSRSEFENTAEKDASGSAAGAIGLLRTTSGRNVLGNLSSKRNAAFSTHQPNKRSKMEHKRPPLQRSNTSMGRLQGRPGDGMRKGPKLKHSESAAPLPGKGADSDKENVSPRSDVGFGLLSSSQGQHHRLSESARDIGERRIRLSHVRRDTSGELDADPENDEELSSFMRGGQKKASVSGDDDLDCVQGLLSLSQGNWR